MQSLFNRNLLNWFFFNKYKQQTGAESLVCIFTVWKFIEKGIWSFKEFFYLKHKERILLVTLYAIVVLKLLSDFLDTKLGEGKISSRIKDNKQKSQTHVEVTEFG